MGDPFLGGVPLFASRILSMSGFDDRNRYSYSGADARAYAFYPLEFTGNPSYPGVAEKLAPLYEKKKALLQKLTNSEINVESIELQLLANEKEIEKIEREISKNLIHIESLATISYQVHEPKAPARALGYRAPKGFARSVRTIAGTMIFIVVEDHPLRRLMDLNSVAHFDNTHTSYSLDIKSAGRGTIQGAGTENNSGVSISTLLKPFNMLVQYSTEVPGGQDPTAVSISGGDLPPIASYMLEGIEIISEGITTSVNDMVTEVVMQFQAHNVYQLSTAHSTVEQIVLSSSSDFSFREAREQELKAQETARSRYLRESFGAQEGESFVDAFIRRSAPR